MSGKVVLGLRNRIDVSTLTSDTAWVSTLPLTNVKTQILGHVARTTTDNAFTITADFSGLPARNIGVVSLAGHNLSRTAAVQIQTYQGETEVDDSGMLSPWPYLAADDPHYLSHTWSASIVDAEHIAEMMPTLVYFLPFNLVANKVVISITNTSNPDGFVEIGRIFVGQQFVPTLNVEYNDVSYSYLDFSEIQTSRRHIKFFNKYKPIRVATAVFKDLSEGEAFGGLYAAQRTTGLTGEVIWAADKPTYRTISNLKVVDSHWFAKAFLANFTALDALSQPYLASRSGAINVEEVAI